ncbi:hypothetical protein A7D27_26585 [Pseudomonas sp. 1D4]|uniref:toxin VasX n=1 Tax=Pseudomonas sp. 1D4 TaxID=1843691 RepID=UPI00084A360F|nr:toxin VasX [Pseudomonas sp. 1D4]OEC35143.1 hypothetical protein A7D27_26585 [Pseudomonas sp. 1D4]
MTANPNQSVPPPAGDARDPVSPCPARQAQLYIVPARYALAEQPAKHPGLQPGVKTNSHPMALRVLRAGFLYLWAGQGPLKRYAVAKNGLLQPQPLDAGRELPPTGSLAGVALDKGEDAWLLHTERPLGEQARAKLAKPGGRRAHMRRVPMQDIACNLQAAHCVPLEKAESLIAELMPEVLDKNRAHEHKTNGKQHQEDARVLGEQVKNDPTPEKVSAYVWVMEWLRLGEQALQRHPGIEQPPGSWSAEAWDARRASMWLDKARLEAGPLYPVVVALDDDLGVLRDLNHEQEQLEARHERWTADNNLRLNMAGFIRSLISEEGGELANLLVYQYREHQLKITQAQGDQLLKTQRALQGLIDEETQVNVRERHRIGHAAADARIADIARRRELELQPVRAFIPANLQREVLDVVRDYCKDKVAQLKGDSAGAKVAEYIDLKRMNGWLEHEAPAHYKEVEARHKVLYADRQVFLPRHGRGTWFVDHFNAEDQAWLDELAQACLSAQCYRRQGAEQLSDHLRARDDGVFHLLFMAWNPPLEVALNSATRAGEVLTALSLDNLEASRAALAKVIGAKAMQALYRAINAAHGGWLASVNLASAALLNTEVGIKMTAHQIGVFVVARLKDDARLVKTFKNGVAHWRLLGDKAQALDKWMERTASGIARGLPARIVNSTAVQNSGGVLPLAILILNMVNLPSTEGIESPDERRKSEALSANLYTSAALVAVIQSWLIRGAGVEELGRGSNVAPTLTLFGGLIGLISFVAASKEFSALQRQMESAQIGVDPWLDIRRLAVAGQVAVYGAQAILGLSLTWMRITKRITTAQAVLRFRLGMGPINLLLMVPGSIHFIAWSLQRTPMQAFLASCCWSKGRAPGNASIPPAQQQAEVDALLKLLYQPRLSLQSRSHQVYGSAGDVIVEDAFYHLQIDLPGALPQHTTLDLTLSGEALPFQYRVGGSNREPSRDLGAQWLAHSRCSWIPSKEGQGLRLAGPLRPSQLQLALRLRYRLPLAALALASSAGQEAEYLGGANGVAFVAQADGDVIDLRPGESGPGLANARSHALTGDDYLQPRGRL